MRSEVERFFRPGGFSGGIGVFDMMFFKERGPAIFIDIKTSLLSLGRKLVFIGLILAKIRGSVQIMRPRRISNRAPNQIRKIKFKFSTKIDRGHSPPDRSQHKYQAASLDWAFPEGLWILSSVTFLRAIC